MRIVGAGILVRGGTITNHTVVGAVKRKSVAAVCILRLASLLYSNTILTGDLLCMKLVKVSKKYSAQ